MVFVSAYFMVLLSRSARLQLKDLSAGAVMKGCSLEAEAKQEASKVIRFKRGETTRVYQCLDVG